MLRDMTDPQGGFYSAEDADSEGEEGKFYVWTPAEIEAVLGRDRAAAFGKVYDVSASGNFEGSNILHLSKPIGVCAKMLGREPAELEAELAADRAELLAARARRVRPGRDDKVLVELERTDDRRAGLRRSGARRTALSGRRRGCRRLPLDASFAMTTAACCTAGGPARRGTRRFSTITPACPTP